MEGIAPLGTLDPQHAVAQFAKALADLARAFALLVRLRGAGARRPLEGPLTVPFQLHPYHTAPE
jgi:hypothetical protein